MVFTPSDFLSVAKDIERALAQNIMLSISSWEEAWIRTGISRAYYAVFLYLRNLTSYRSYKTSDVHRQLIDFLKYLGGNYGKIGQKLRQLRNKRNRADYDLPPYY